MFSELFINNIFEYTFVLFVSDKYLKFKSNSNLKKEKNLNLNHGQRNVVIEICSSSFSLPNERNAGSTKTEVLCLAQWSLTLAL